MYSNHLEICFLVVYEVFLHEDAVFKNTLKKYGIRRASLGKESTCSAGDLGSTLSRKGPLEGGMAPHSRTRAWEAHGQGSLVGCLPWGRKESDTTQRLSLSLEF